MSINYAQSSADILGRASVSSKYFSPADSPSVTQYTYVRNPSWLAIPTMSASDQAVYALHAVFREGNYVAFTCAGNYTVNWGDNVTESFNSGSTAYHIYDYNSSSFDGTNAPVEFTSSNDTVVRNNHGYVNNNSVVFAEIDNTVSGSMGGIQRSARYYVVNATQNNFQISLTQNGTPIDITSNGTGRILNYKQAIITITPQSGQNLSVINLNVKHNATGLQTYSSGFLDLNIGSPNLTTLRIGSSASNTTYVITHHMLARARLYSSALVNCQYMFYNCLGLEQATIDGIGASSVNFTQMFGECYGVYDIKFNCDTAAVTNIGSMFINCRSLIYAPFFNTSNATTASSLFQDCQSLNYLPPYNFGAATTVASMFLRCRSLKYCPGFDTKNATTFVSLFQDCPALQGFGAFNATKVTTINSMCNNCYSLDSLPMMDFKSVTTATNAFNGCYSLKTIPKFNFEKLANAGNMFFNCYSMTTFPITEFPQLTNIEQAFYECRSLANISDLNTPKLTGNVSYTFYNNQALKKAPYFNTSRCGGSFEGIFQGCSSLREIPQYNMQSGSNTSRIHNSNSALEIAPAFDLRRGTTLFSYYWNANALKTVPNMRNTSLVTQAGIMFVNNYALETVGDIDLSGIATSSNFSGWTSAPNLSSIGETKLKVSFSVAGCKLGVTALENLFLGLGKGTSQTVTITNNVGAPTPVTSSGTTVAGSTTITMASTTGIATGMQVTGIGTALTTPISCSFQDTGDTVTVTSHSLVDADLVAFPSITSTTGISTDTIYYVVNPTTNTFQVAATSGGSALALTTNGTGTLRYIPTVTSITPNTSIEISRPATLSGTNTLSYRVVKTGYAILKGWAISG